MTIIKTEDMVTSLHADDPSFGIRDALREAIMERRLAPGAKLVESDVGALFDVGRTIARSALQMLSFEGLVSIERNRGAFVANPSPDEARQVFASRRLVEAGIAEAVCARATADDIAALRRHLEKEHVHMNERGANARRAEIKASGDFHLKIARINENPILLRFMEELVARSSLVIALYGRTGISSCGHNEHEWLVDAIERADAGSARKLMLQHIDHIEADLDLTATPHGTLEAALKR